MSLTPRFRHRFFVAALAVGLTALPPLAVAQSNNSDTSLPGITTQPEKGSRPTDSGQSDDAAQSDETAAPDDSAPAQNDSVVTRPLNATVGTFKTEKVGPGAEPKADDAIKPSQGVGVFDRMGAKLPDLPPEKPFTGKVDEAYGAFQRGYYLTAFQKALPRAQLGDPAAQTLLAELMSQGLGVKRDTKDAAFWYGKAAEGGDATSMFKYALLLMEGRDVPRDEKKADEWMKKAADAGQASAEFNWGQSLTADNPGIKGLQMALPYYEKAAQQGIADAQYAVSQLYLNLPDLPQEKKEQAREWLSRAANAGFDTAQLDMGIWLINGIGGKQDLENGFNWMKVAAYRGNVVAQNKLAHLYINALGTKQDPVAAATWYVISRRAGLKDPELEDFYQGIEDYQQKAAIDAANKFRRSQ
ncbi:MULTISPECIES: tetratricopeptide repeat protein [unclassified Rhizobium]|uniref:tetratricopeptide repeat protein n=1 Tax=unclassified Rhizobium TaxID=2613769 RepID=UPI000CF1ED1E|nr:MULTISPECIES: tetratricopeptide repeat protein [Rhizobium]MDK4738178.1 tetratricopeptide repeat protein [Rhizobium sp. CNPSo 3464]UWU20205.1 sel1 repeat family protein [Rhizobium tropici]